MTALTANFKHLYQRRGFWVIDLVVLSCVVVAAALREEHVFVIFPYPIFIAGLFLGAMQVEILAKSFVYCLPGHARIPLRLLFGIAIALGLVWALLCVVSRWNGLLDAMTTGISVFSATTLFFWLGVWMVFTFRNWISAVAFFPFAVLLGNYVSMEVWIRVLTEGWLFVAAAGCGVNLITWRFLRDNSLARRYCGRLWLGTFDAWNKERMTRFSQARMAEKKWYGVLPGVEQFFLGRIRGGSDLARCIWGNLYRSGLGVALSRRKGWVSIVLMWLVIACFLGYTGPGGNFLFIMPGLIFLQMRLGVHSSLLIASGRRERFWAALVLAAATAVSVTGVVTLIAGVSVVLQPVMPAIALRGQAVAYHAMDMRLFFVPLAIVPVTLTFAVVFYRYPRLAFGATLVIFMLLIQTTLFARLVKFSPPVVFHPAIVVTVIVAGCWAVFTAVLRYICMRRCLVR